MDKQLFFSIILPAYNASAFLSSTLKSILSQEYANFEVLLINDGSTDNTEVICEHYANLDKRIFFISKQNEGVSITRNKGLEIAKGKYILFIDADDILYPKALTTIHNFLKNKEVDYLRYEYQTINEKGNQLYPNYEAKMRGKIANKNLDAPNCITRIIRNEFFLWSGVFRKKIIDKYHLHFMEGCTYNEDTLFMIQYLMHSTTHFYIPEVLYGYRKFEGAVTAHFTSNNFQDVKKVINSLLIIHSSIQNHKMQIGIKSVIERLSLHLLYYTQPQNISNIFTFCHKHPILIEWKVINIFGYSCSKLLLPFINIAKKIYRKYIL